MSTMQTPLNEELLLVAYRQQLKDDYAENTIMTIDFSPSEDGFYYGHKPDRRSHPTF